MSPPDNNATKHADDGDHPSKRLRTGDVGPNRDPSSSPLNRPDYNGGCLVPMCSPFFPELRKALGRFLVDKTKLIEDVINSCMCGTVDLVLRPRRCGKTTMLRMMYSFFSVPEDGIDQSHLFSGLYIADQHKICQEHMGKYNVIFLDFRLVTGTSWEHMLGSFRLMVSCLYGDWQDYLQDSLDPTDEETFRSIRNKVAADETLGQSLRLLSRFLAKKSRQKVIVLIDEYEAPNNCAYEHGFFKQANEFFGRGVLAALLKTNEYLEYGLLAGVTPTTKAGWYSGLNNILKHPLHEPKSVFAGKLMFTEDEVQKLIELTGTQLDPKALKEHYNSYLADGHISVYNPVSIMSAFRTGKISNFWIQTGEFPLLCRNIPEDVSALDKIAVLLCHKEISFKLQESVPFSNSTLDISSYGTWTLLYYAGYLTMTSAEGDQFKIPNQEVMDDWTRWFVETFGGDFRADKVIVDECVKGPVDIFQQKWPDFMQNHLSPKLVNIRGRKTPERNYQVFVLAVMLCLRVEGWEVTIGYTSVWLVSKTKKTAVLIELKSSDKAAHIEKDAKAALDQIEEKNYRTNEVLQGVRILREYGIGCYHLRSHVEGRYLELDAQKVWVERDRAHRR